MVTVQKPSAGSKSSITSIASGNDSQSILNANLQYETSLDGSGVPLKVRKPYTISKQREKWTEEEHQKFIEALKLYGRTWRQIEEYIGTKTAVQIRSHAQKFFTKVMKEGSGSPEGPVEPIEIPPPRPKRKPLHPYPRKSVKVPNKVRLCSSVLENGTSNDLKTTGRGSHSSTLVRAPEGSQISISHAKDLGSGGASATSSGSNLSHVVEDSLNNNNSSVRKEKEKEETLLLTMNLSVPSLDDLTSENAATEFKDAELCKDAYSVSQIKFAPLKTIKLFGHNLVLSDPLEHADGINKVSKHTAASSNLPAESLFSKQTQINASMPELVSSLNGQIGSSDLMGERSIKKKSSRGISCTGSNSNTFRGAENVEPETNKDSADSRNEFTDSLILSMNNCRKGFDSCKRYVSAGEAAALMNTQNDRESQWLRVFL